MKEHEKSYQKMKSTISSSLKIIFTTQCREEEQHIKKMQSSLERHVLKSIINSPSSQGAAARG